MSKGDMDDDVEYDDGPEEEVQDEDDELYGEDDEEEEAKTPRKSSNPPATSASASSSSTTSPSTGTPSKPKKPRHKVTPLESALNPLSKEQFVGIVCSFFQKHPEFEDEIMGMLPQPDQTEIFKELEKLERQYGRLFPNTRFGSSHDNYSYNRVVKGLGPFKKKLLDHGVHLKASKSWVPLLNYVGRAITFAVDMPQWDNEEKNKSRNSAIKSVDSYGKAAVKGIGATFTPEQWEAERKKLETEASGNIEHLKETIEEIQSAIEKSKKASSKKRRL